MGGFARRTRFWTEFARKYPDKPTLRLDGGSIFVFGPAEAPIQNRWILEGTFNSKLDALNLSSSDLPVWREFGDLAAAGQIPAQWLRLPLVSANVAPKVAGFPKVRRYIVKEIPIDPKSGKNLRIGITGVLFDPEERVSRAEFEVQDPEKSLRQVVEEMKADTDYRVVLTEQTLGKDISLAVSLPAISLMAVSHDYSVAADPQQVGDTLLFITVNEGRMISEARVAVDMTSSRISLETRFIPLDRTVPGDPAMAELERRANAELAKFKEANR